MFTGLVEAVGTINRMTSKDDVRVFQISAPFSSELNRGDSVAVSGVCSTVTDFSSSWFCVEMTEETLSVSRFGSVVPGERVNLERALRVTDRLDGHIAAGHVDGVGKVLSLERGRNAAVLRIEVPRHISRYIVRKGSVCVDGVSLTVASESGNAFSVAVIPETLARTTLGGLTAGMSVNLESDILARYAEKLMGLSAPAEAKSGGLTQERLAEMGW
ncbi:MAG: riboflavin synthase [Pyramidobacter sp.]|nr:riboflavin synthase [Pyramidobacter sp.]